ncbi:hypothetical protein ONZ45_g18114 [Pleurotus djamor]|nr:hypothetical protein ONZ45_g18114 [Pleurotus djamor]
MRNAKQRHLSSRNYLFDDKPGTTTAFPDDFRMLSGDPMLRTYDASSHAQQAVTFLCLDFNGVTTRHNEIPAKNCPSGIRSQVNFPSCWDGKNVDSPDHKSHVAYQANGPDSGGCKDPKFPVVLPRIFNEIYWSTNAFDNVRSQAKNPSQPFVFSNGDPTGYGYHGDFFNGWDSGVLQKAVDGCNCNIYGDPTCCGQKGIFTLTKDKKCFITPTVDEPVLGTLPKLPGNNPVQPAGKRATAFPDNTNPPILSPVRAYTNENSPPAKGQPVAGGVRVSSSVAPSVAPSPICFARFLAPRSSSNLPISSIYHLGQPSGSQHDGSAPGPTATLAPPSPAVSSAQPAASSGAPSNPYPYPYPAPVGSGSSGSGSQHSAPASGSTSTIVLAPVASSPPSHDGAAPGPVVAAPSKGNSTKGPVKCKHRENTKKQFKQYLKAYHAEVKGHKHDKREFSHDMSTGRRRFARSRALDV